MTIVQHLRDRYSVNWSENCSYESSKNYSLTAGTLTSDVHLEFVVQSDALVLFGDGIEADHLTVGWGQKLTVGTTSRTLTLA
ncbi:phosphoribosylformylglycinamidine synthase subunit II [marine actinobacterium PHSC20C1]|nr:phosphoribosylformylglycinamidine synthase subunit II [marine actinobacterium PHSC20C1]